MKGKYLSFHHFAHRETIIGKPTKFCNGVILPGKRDLGVHLAEFNHQTQQLSPQFRKNTFHTLRHPNMSALLINLEECCRRRSLYAADGLIS